MRVLFWYMLAYIYAVLFNFTGHGADGQLSIGKEVWLFHSKLNASVLKETVDVLCYSNGRSNHLEVGFLNVID